jgi:hypothetical protein
MGENCGPWRPRSTLGSVNRTLLVLMMCAMVSPLFCQAAGQVESRAMPAPKLPFLDWKACPFEGCAYREWTALKPVVVYDTWEQKRRTVARLSPGDVVTGVTGVVITFKPGVIRMDRDLAAEKLKQGDTILTYTYRGEGFSAVWFGGRYYTEFDISFAKWPDGSGCGGAHCAATYLDLGNKVWWAQVKLKSGFTGWVNMNYAEFDGVDLLARSITSVLAPI